MLDANMKAQLAAYLERMTQPVEIVASLDDSTDSADMRALLQDIAEASPLMKVSETRGGPHRTPSFSVNRPGENHGPPSVSLTFISGEASAISCNRARMSAESVLSSSEATISTGCEMRSR